MGFFWNTKPKVITNEFKKVRNHLWAKGFTRRELDEIEQIFRADLDESQSTEQGISKEEIEKGIQWMKQHVNVHKIPEYKIAILEQALKEKL